MNLSDKAKIFMTRFRGRDDVYGKKWYSKEGKGNYTFVCTKLFSDKCHIKLNDGITCATCKIKEHEPVTEVSVIKHITGKEEHAMYVVRTDGMVYFGAVDFDCKPGGKADSTYYWEDVKKTCDVLDQLGIKYGVARSTTDGFHVYMFFAEPYSAHKFSQIVTKLIFKMTGFEAERANGIRKFPEFFPKQAFVGTEGYGNSIKPPMIEARWDIQRNCFVNGNNEMINIDQQWNHLRDIPNNTPQHMDEIIMLYGIEIDGTAPPKDASKKAMYAGGGVYDFDHGTWQRPHSGSIEKVIQGCAAFRRLREKMDSGYVPNHDEGLSLFHTGGLATRDGWDYFKDGKIPGWHKTQGDINQLLQSVRKNYKPWTCKTMQDKGICIPGTKCFEKRPPVKIKDGCEFFDISAPQNEWPDPSPIRYARGDGEDFLKKLLDEVKEVAKLENLDQKSDAIRKIALRAQVFDKDQQGVLKKAISESGLVKARELNQMFNKAEKEKMEETERIMGDNSDYIKEGGSHYQKKRPYGYKISRKIKGNDADMVDLCAFDLWIREIVVTIEDNEQKSKIYRCVIAFNNTEKSFEVPADVFFDNNEFYKLLGTMADSYMTLKREDLTDARVAWLLFSRKHGINELILNQTQGWNNSLSEYSTQNLVIDKFGIRLKEESENSPKESDFSKHLRFSLISKDILLETLLQIKTELLNAYPAGYVQICLGHSVSAIISSILEFEQHPALFLSGRVGTSKTSLAKLIMLFWGDFKTFPKWQTSSVAALARLGWQFKDALLFVDDHKEELNTAPIVQGTVQNAFDRNIDAKLQKDSKMRESFGHRGELIATGENVPGEIESVLSRMFIIEVQPPPPNGDNLYQLCKKASPNYKGVLPHFINWFLQQQHEVAKNTFHDYIQYFKKQLNGKHVAQRIATSLAQNMISWKLFCDFLIHLNAIDLVERDELMKNHEQFLIEVGLHTCESCGEEQAGVIFRSALVGQVALDALHIKGIHDENTRHCFIGQYDPQKDPDHVYLDISVTYQQVMAHLSARKLKTNDKAIARQLRDLGFIVNKSKVIRPDKADGDGKSDPTRFWTVPMAELLGPQIAIEIRTKKLHELQQLENEKTLRGQYKFDGLI